MSLVLGCCREITAGPIIGFHQGGGGGDAISSSSSSKHCLKITTTSSNTEKKPNNNNNLSCFSLDPDFSSSSSEKSSIGGESSDDDDDDDDECTSNVSQRKFKMDSLEESLPIKRGLSNFFSGRSKSFANLSEATSVESLGKTENPFNKRRRTLIACKMSRQRRRRTPSFYSSSIISPVSMPLLKLNEEDDEDEDEEDDEENQTETDDDDDDDDEIKKEKLEISSISNLGQSSKNKIKRFRTKRCFSLTDLNHHHQHQIQ